MTAVVLRGERYFPVDTPVFVGEFPGVAQAWRHGCGHVCVTVSCHRKDLFRCLVDLLSLDADATLGVMATGVSLSVYAWDGTRSLERHVLTWVDYV
jgi:hypothetical protein